MDIEKLKEKHRLENLQSEERHRLIKDAIKRGDWKEAKKLVEENNRIIEKSYKKFPDILKKHKEEYVNAFDPNYYKRYKIDENDGLKNYQVFRKNFEYILEHRHGGIFSEKSINYATGIIEELSNAKIFKIPDNVKFLLTNTSNHVRKVKFPFIECFFDVKLVVFDRVYYGFFFLDNGSFIELFKKEHPNWRKEQKDHNVDLDSFNKDIQIFTLGTGEYGETDSGNFYLHGQDGNKYYNKIREFTMNLVDFINSEEVKLVFKLKTKKSRERRIKMGMMGLPSYNEISVIGYLKKYINKLQAQKQSRSFDHKFWVRGHFRHFWHKKYDKLYNLVKEGKIKKRGDREYILDNGTLKLWIYPHIKGEGMLVNKNYKLR